MTYLFILGNTPHLAAAELEAVLKKHQIQSTFRFAAPVFVVKTNNPIEKRVFSQLGGTVKVAEVFKTARQQTAEDIVNYLRTFPEEKFSFGLSVYTPNYHISAQDNKSLKEKLEQEGKKVRFVLPVGDENALSSVVVAKQKLVEIVIAEIDDQFLLARTVWVQNFTDWNRRDYGRPAIEAHIGMLPPKVARMMVNLVISNFQFPISNLTILDPFCGVGTTLSEALLLGTKVIGSDSNINQVERTKRNLDWLANSYQITKDRYQIYNTDARAVSEALPNIKVDAIVTEPDLGPSGGIPPQKITERLADLYRASLADWRKIIVPGGPVVIIFPHFVKNVIDKVQIMGYSVVAGPWEYHRPQAVIKRNIYFLRYGPY